MLNLSDQRVADAIHKQHLHTLETLHTPKASKLLARIMLGLLLISLGGMFLPWQQNVSGYGEITALSVQDRPQSLQNAIPGMIDRWWVQEGAFVRKGDTILTIRETKDDYFDPQILVRLQEQVDAQDQSIVATQQKVGSYRSQIVALQQNQELSLQKARNKIRQARLKVTSDSVEVVKARNDYKVAVNQLERYKGVFAKGIISKTEFEARQLKLVETETKVQSAEAKLSVTRQEYLNALIELTSVVPDYNEKIAKAQSDLNATLKDVADADAKLSQLRNKYSSVKVRRGYYAVVAPQDGTVVRAAKAGIGETIKEGESIAVLQPSDPSTAVAVYIRALDVPLLAPGRKVRLEFEGWPALQWAAGWPGTSVGTFGGVIEVIDFTESKDGKYRMLVKPDPTENKWPTQLRVGSKVFGWVMLDDVPIWWEVWRQLNGFPPNMPEDNKQKEEDIKPKTAGK